LKQAAAEHYETREHDGHKDGLKWIQALRVWSPGIIQFSAEQISA